MTDKKTPGTITAYKAFDADWSCRGFVYEAGKTYTHDGPVEMCASGFHACELPFDCWNFYPGSMNFASVELGAVSNEKREDSKRVGASITIAAQLTLPDWIAAQANAVVDLCRTAKKALASGDCKNAAATGYMGHAAATGDRGHAAATGGYGHAAATGGWGHAAATGYMGHAAATGISGHAAATGYMGHAAATGDSGHAAATGYRGHAAATGYMGHAAATGHSGHAAVEGKNAIAASLGIAGTATAKEGGAICLAAYDDNFAAYDDNFNLVAVRSSLVGENGIEVGKTYRLTTDGEFAEVEQQT